MKSLKISLLALTIASLSYPALVKAEPAEAAVDCISPEDFNWISTTFGAEELSFWVGAAQDKNGKRYHTQAYSKKQPKLELHKEKGRCNYEFVTYDGKRYPAEVSLLSRSK